MLSSVTLLDVGCLLTGSCRLDKEEKGGNWLYNIDQLAPLEIYD